MSTLSQFAGGVPPVWVSNTTYTQGRVVRSPIDWQEYVRITNGAGTTDPSADTTNYRPTGGRAIKSLQTGVISIPTGGATTTATATIAAVNTSKYLLINLGGGTSGNGGARATLVLTNSTTITATRGAGDGSASDSVSYLILEFH